MASLALLSLETAGAKPARVADAQEALGQYMTPPAIAAFMADQFEPHRFSRVRLLDAGAGQGALSVAARQRWAELADAQSRLTIDAFEVDTVMIEALKANLARGRADPRIRATVRPGDFIANAVGMIRQGQQPYTHAILNPPYKKIAADSDARSRLESVGIDTGNLYSAFVALSLKLLEPGGELVAIVPRSFCNGPYFKPFRRQLIGEAAIRSIHLFIARDKAFAGDSVLQENIIIGLVKGGRQDAVHISTSTDATFTDLRARVVPFSEVVRPGDPDQFIRIPSDDDRIALPDVAAFDSRLADLRIDVSTGPVVDFRVKRHLRAEASGNDAPLIYPGHFEGARVRWPRTPFRKPNAIALNSETARLLYPSGFYVLVRRFSSKEERRRIVATLISPVDVPAGPIGFENHLNVLHRKRHGLPEPLARGLMTYLNAKVVDDWFRQFNGHTQVNATDLRSLPYPNESRLVALGGWQADHPAATREEVDAKVAELK